jgi:Sec-independent protein secretion pathway component TatC
MTNLTPSILEDVKIHVKLKISALWIAVMLLFAYGDIFGFFKTGLIEGIIAGKISGFQINQGFLGGSSIFIAIPCVMIFLSLVLRPDVNRWANIVLGLLYTATILLFCIGEEWAYYFFLSLLESVLLLVIVWYAWKWPEQESPKKSVT